MRRHLIPKDTTKLTAEAAAVLNHAVAEAQKRNHREATPLHVAAAALAHPSSITHRLDWSRLELCFSAALLRLPAGKGPAQAGLDPPISKSLRRALIRAQSRQSQRRVEQKPSEDPEVELEELICPILDDPFVVRVLSEAGFCAGEIKASVSSSANSMAVDSGEERLQVERTKEVNRAINVLLRGRKRNPVLVGESEPVTVVKELLRRLGSKQIEYEMLKNVHVIHLEKEFPHGAQIPSKILHLGRIIDSSRGNLYPGGGVIIHLGDLKWLLEEDRPELAAGCTDIQQTLAVEMVGTLLKRFREGTGGGKIWLIGMASCETYMRCQGRHPALEDDWDLHPLMNAADSALSGMGSILRQGNVAKQGQHNDGVKPVAVISRAKRIPFLRSRSESMMANHEVSERLEGQELSDGMLEKSCALYLEKKRRDKEQLSMKLMDLEGVVEGRTGNVDSGGIVLMIGPATQETHSRRKILDHTMANDWNLEPVAITGGAPLSVMFPRSRFETGNHDQATCVLEQPNSMTSLMSSTIFNITSRDDRRQLYGPQFLPKALSSNSYCAQFLVHLILPNFTNNSTVKQFQNGSFFKHLVNLKLMDLSDSSLTRLPETSAAQKLEILNLSGCVNLLDVLSIHRLSKLQHVKLRGCISVRRLPSLCNLRLLKTLDLSNCSRLNKLPPSMGHLSSLVSLDLTHCKQLERLPGSIFKLKLLETVTIAGCSGLMKRFTIGEKQVTPDGNIALFSNTCGTEAMIISHQTRQIERKLIAPQPEEMELEVPESHTTPTEQPESEPFPYLPSVTKVSKFIHNNKTKKQLGVAKPKPSRTSFKVRPQVFSLSPQGFREKVEALTAGGCPAFFSALARKKKNALRDYLSMSLEHIHFLPNGFLSIETVVHSLLGKHRASLLPSEQIALQGFKHSLAELSQSFPGIVMTMENAEAEKAVLVAKSTEVEERLADGAQELASVEAEFSKVLEEEELLDAEIQCLIAKKLEFIGASM